MEISKDILRKEMISLLTEIDLQMGELERIAERRGVIPQHIRDDNGSWPMIALLAAKVQAVSTLAQLRN